VDTTAIHSKIVFKGIWEIDKEFSGGAFVSHILYNFDKKTAYLVDGFLFAPGEKKRNYFLQLNYLLNQVEIQ
jgi:hypothetical protein